MQLTKQHIASLFTFTEKHYVEWYDLQTELVDHLANDIEQIWKEEPNLTFTEARNKSFKKFGVFGFSELVKKRQNALNKKYWKLILKEFKLFFSLPKILLTAFLIASYFSILNYLENINALIIVSLGLFVIIEFIFLFVLTKKIKRKHKTTGKKWLVENTFASLGGFAFLGITPIQIFQLINYTLIINYWGKWFIATIIVCFGIFLFIGIRIIPKKITSYMVKNYPEYQPIL
ncbi:hypothetical protein JBL43_04535 [Aureibaculum sp. A20]|uniref:Uncharacterized protein n=1 Tax=Aureibaculum flavum TaxID=2795986 RepID=A0ABS0WND7_9FLAO|nr:hypothetical protein [Aureibaculum flavum]MBJ2173490.1 hypothetical protein [Aureibaculum flavum]